MKLINHETILESEKEFIDTINAELDWEAIEKMLLDKYSFTLQEEIDYKNGDLVVCNDKIAYKFDFEIKVPLSVIFNREGECLEISTTGENLDEKTMDTAISPEQDDKVALMASNIADMISEINEPENDSFKIDRPGENQPQNNQEGE